MRGLFLLLLLASLFIGCDDSPTKTPVADLAGDGTGDQGGDQTSTDQTSADQVDQSETDQLCVPDCLGKSCGPDGCGAQCATCGNGTICDGSSCVASNCPTGCTVDCQQGCFDMGGCTASGGATLYVHPNILTAGLVLTQSGAPETAQVYYRRAGEATWLKGHDATRIPDGRLATSLFGLAPDHDYEAMLLAGGATGCGSFTTQPETPPHTTSETLYVSAGATGGNGTQGAPFGTIQAAVDVASAGTDVVIAAGVYHEAVTIGRSGSDGAYLKLLGEPGAILDGSSQLTGLSWTADGPNVYWTDWSGDPRYLGRDNARQYHFITLQGLRDGIGDDGVVFDEGFFVEGGRLYVRSQDAPGSHTWQVPDLNTAIGMDGQAWVWIEGLEIRWYGEGDDAKGIDVRASNHVVVRNNHLHDMPSPVWVRRDSAWSRVQDNRIHQSSVPSWEWAAVKGTDHENSAVTIEGGEGAIVSGNAIWDLFNGIYTGSFSDDQNPALAYDVDVYGNRMRRVTDDGMEPEGACVNNRFWGNTIDEVHNGLSLAPITYGPVWAIGNRFTRYTQSGFKVSNDSSGRVWLYHNTCWSDFADQNGMNVSGYFENMVFRNNIIRGTSYSLEMSQAAGPNDLDYDNLFTTRGAPVIKWDNVRYDSLAALCTATGLECHGLGGDPGLQDPNNGAFALLSDSSNVDVAQRLYGINDGFAGSAPDVGYLEFGAPEVPVLAP